MRCSALADALKEDGWHCTFVVAEAGAAAVRRLAESRHQVVTIPEKMALDAAAASDAAGACDLLVVDHYEWSAPQETACRPWARRILVIDDLEDRSHDCDLLLDMSLETARRKGLLGPGFALLRSAFAELRLGLDRRARSAPPERLFVNFGLMDDVNLTERTLDVLQEARYPGTVDVVLGSQARHLARIEERARRASRKVRLHVEPPDIAALMASADFAIGAAGGSSWERCCLALPSIAVRAASNQERNARALYAAGASLLAESLSAEVLDVLQDRAAVERMAAAASAITDGRGARRVALALRPERASDGGQVTLRRLGSGDAGLTHEWQRHPATRRYARNPAAPSLEEHSAWLARKLGDPGCVIDMVLHDGRPAGVVRADRLQRPDGQTACEVSIYIAPELHGRGVGLAALAALRRLVPEAVLVANVLQENSVSHRLFVKSGYVLDNGAYISAPLAPRP